VNASFYTHNRQKVIDALTKKVPIIIAGNTQMQKAGDTAFGFFQESNFLWLTGIEEPDWQVIIDPLKNKTWLVSPNVSETHRIFDGSLSDEIALKKSGAGGVLNPTQAKQKLAELAKAHEVAYVLGDHPYMAHFDFVENPAQARLNTTLKKIFDKREDIRPILAKLKAIKQPEELVAMQAAIDLTIEAFEQAKQNLADRTYEYEVEADFDYAFRRKNATHAYDPIVAGGANAVTLHYVKNNQALKEGLLLLDIGARVDGYSADITRTYAVGNVSQRERAVHAAVQKAQQECIALLGPGMSVREYSEKVDEIMKRALESLDLLKEEADYRIYFPHAISHGLGIDVHDSLGAPETFQPGMVLTVEPGIYIPEEGIGVRIEDDILITEDGYKNLSLKLSTEL
jgi:Xaa-Pro aminopeptidase